MVFNRAVIILNFMYSKICDVGTNRGNRFYPKSTSEFGKPKIFNGVYFQQNSWRYLY